MQGMTAELFFKVGNRWDGLPAELNINRVYLQTKAHPSFPNPERRHAPFISHGSFKKPEPFIVKSAQPPVRLVVDFNLLSGNQEVNNKRETALNGHLDRIGGPQAREYRFQGLAQVFRNRIQVLVRYYPYRYLRFYSRRNHRGI